MSDTPNDAADRSPTLRLATRGPLFAATAALRARIELGFPARQFAPVVIPARPTKATWERVLQTTPFTGLCWLGLSPEKDTGALMRCSADYLVYLGCKNTVPAGLLNGDAYGAGLLGFASLGTALLHGWSTPDVGTWRVTGVDNAAIAEMISEDVGVVALQVSCNFTLIDRDAAEALPDFLRLGADWGLPPLADGGVLELRAA